MMIGDQVHGANLVDIVYGGAVPGVGDPAEDYLEASKLRRAAMGWDAPGVSLLTSTPELHPVVARAGRRYRSLPATPLPPHPTQDAALEPVLVRRRSADPGESAAVPLPWLAGILRLAYGVRPGTGLPPLRPTPSAGALYPLDLLVVVRDVPGLPGGLYAYDPYDDALVRLGDLDLPAFARACLQEELVAAAAVSVVVTAAMWRSRFKYGQRALRFALLEAGHLAQNALLVAESMQLAARPLGGFCDDELNGLLGLDGVDEVPLYVLAVGSR